MRLNETNFNVFVSYVNTVCCYLDQMSNSSGIGFPHRSATIT